MKLLFRLFSLLAAIALTSLEISAQSISLGKHKVIVNSYVTSPLQIERDYLFDYRFDFNSNNTVGFEVKYFSQRLLKSQFSYGYGGVVGVFPFDIRVRADKEATGFGFSTYTKTVGYNAIYFGGSFFFGYKIISNGNYSLNINGGLDIVIAPRQLVETNFFATSSNNVFKKYFESRIVINDRNAPIIAPNIMIQIDKKINSNLRFFIYSGYTFSRQVIYDGEFVLTDTSNNERFGKINKRYSHVDLSVGLIFDKIRWKHKYVK